MKLLLYQVDAFTDTLFKGNPAAVCLLPEWFAPESMQNIAAENNLAETAFIIKKDELYEIRWFTPTTEVELCGHATLATAHVLFNHEGFKGDIITFSSQSGILKVSKEGVLLVLNFPVDAIAKVPIPNDLFQAFSISPIDCYKGKTDYMLVFSNQKEIETLEPDFNLLNKAEARGVIVTAKGDEVDFVSRFFAPQVGIPEDPVTGSAHTILTPYWSDKLHKTELTAMQLSKRQGKLFCKLAGDRVEIAGHAKTYLKGEIEI